MLMTAVEFFLLILSVVAIYAGLAPLRKRIEYRLRKLLQGASSEPGPVIDITDYSKRDKPQ